MGFINKMVRDVVKSKDLKTMEALYRGNSNDTVIKFEYDKMLLYYGHYEKAKKLLLELLNTRNADFAMLELGRAERMASNPAKALEYFETLANKNDVAAIFELAKLVASLGDVDRARKLLLSIIDNDPKNYSRIELGKIEASEGNVDLAKKYFKEAYTIQKQTAGKVALGRLERGLGNIAEARKQFEVAIQKGDLSGKFELGKMELAEGNVEEARRIFESLYNDDKILSALIELGKLEVIIGNLEKAKSYFLALEGTRLERFGYYNLILVAVKQNDYDSAFVYLKKALDRGNWVDPALAVDVSKKLNVFFDTNYESFVYNYTLNQLINYDPYTAIEHIIERHANQTKNDFNKDIDFYKLFNEIKPLLTEDRKINVFGYNDTYIVPYPNVGANNENYLRVITLPNTKDIVTMFPDFNRYTSQKYSTDNEQVMELTRILD